MPRVRRHLVESWRLYSAWSRHELPDRAAPFLPLHVYALAQYCREQRWQSTVVLLLLGFETWLRTGELFSVRKHHCHIHPRLGTGVVFLPTSKAGSRTGAQESVSVADPFVGRCLYLYLSTLSANDLHSQERPQIQR
eukprot:2318093-Amphidinium_carterae.1